MNKILLCCVIVACALYQVAAEPAGGYKDRCKAVYIEHSYFRPDNYFSTINQQITYYCNEGYTLVGDSVATCLPSGWDIEPPQCIPDGPIVHCKRQIEFLENGEIDAPDTVDGYYNVGQRIWYRCNDGYVIEGKKDVTCLDTGLWNYPAPSCVPAYLPCFNREAPVNGAQNPDIPLYEPGQIVEYTCNVPYVISDPNPVICLPNGEWSADVPTCGAPTCRDLVKPENGFFTPKLDVYEVGQMVTFRCFRHYKLVGSNKITCQKNGLWTDDEPECMPISCDPLVPPVNGALYPVKTSYKVGERVTFSCDPHFTRMGSKDSVCLSNGEFSNSVPTCEAGQCPRPVLDNGSFQQDKPTYDVGDVVTFSCDVGYVLQGSQTTECGLNKDWTEEFPVCVPVVCDRPIFDNGILIEDKLEYIFNEEVLFICDDGYQLVGLNQLTCTSSGFWSGPFPTCEPITCATPLIDNGFLTPNKNQYSVGEPVLFTCDEGFMLKGLEELTCLSTGSWSHDFPICIPNQCTRPVLDNGFFVEDKELYDAGETVSFFCNDGYTLVGEQTLDCQNNAEWSDDFPICEPVLCKRPTFINGFLIEDKQYYSVGESVVFKCDPGFNLNGEDTLTCQSDGTWSDEFPVCNALQCDRPIFENGDLNADKQFYSIHETVVFICNKGFIREGPKSLKCQNDGTWSGDFPICIPVQCDRPIFENGFLTEDKTSYDVEEEVIFTCDEGFTLKGAKKLTCLSTGGWSGRFPICKPVTCNRPFIDNGSFEDDKNAYPVGEVVTFSCNFNFILIGAEQVTCESNGDWSDDFPICIPYTCAVPTIDNGSIQPVQDSYDLNEQVHFSCNPGYSLDGVKTVTCGFKGVWSSEFPTCQPNACAEPVIENGQFMSTGNDFSVGVMVIFRCDRGFVLEGEKKLTCEDDGQWSENFPLCKPVTCSRPVVTVGVLFSPSKIVYQVGNSVTFRCKSGRSLVGAEVVTCENDGEWSDSFPTCEANTCSVPFVDNGSFSPVKLTYSVGNQVEFTCDVGFELNGVELVQCQRDGTWSNDFPTCEPVTCINPFIDNGSIDPVQDDYFYTNEVTFSCNAGFTLNGAETITCLASGKWSAKFPICERNRCGRPQRNPNIISILPSRTSYSIGQTVTFKCRQGFELQGSETSTCQSDQTWSPVEPTCRRVVQCRGPTKPRYSIADPYKRVYSVGETITYSCREGFVLEGNEVITCQKNGQFSSRPPICKRRGKKCRRPYLPRHAVIFPVKDEYDFEDMVVFRCEKNLLLEGQNRAICLSDGTWSARVPSCVFQKIDTCRIRGCSERWDRRQDCQCNRFCKYLNNCCHDYKELC